MKKNLLLMFMFLICISLVGCNSNPTNPNDDDDDDTVLPSEYDYETKIASLEFLETSSVGQKIQGAPDLLITGIVADTYYYYHYESLSAYEYVKVYNNTEEDYNLKNHRIMLANPLSGQNYEADGATEGLSPLVTNHLFAGMFSNDFIIPSFSIGVVWIKPYYWTAGSGSGSYNEPFSTNLIHKDSATQKGAFNQNLDDFRTFWNLDENFPVYELTNMGIVGKKVDSGNADAMYPIFNPGANSFSHLNTTLLRSIEIQKFNDQDGAASLELLNEYNKLSDEKQKNPDPIYTKTAFNVMAIKDPTNSDKDENDVIDGYLYTNVFKYFDSVVRATFCGKVDTSTFTPGQTTVDFTNTSNGGVVGYENTMEFVFLPPKEGEKIMTWLTPLREKSKYDTYLTSVQKEVLRFYDGDFVDYRYVDKTIKLLTDPTFIDLVNWRTDEIYSEGRMSSAAPDKIFNIYFSI